MAAQLCQVPNATINIVDEEWLHAIATVGGPGGRFPRDDIPCDLVVRSGQELVAPDTATVPILAGSPVIDGTLGRIGFYASVPMRTLTGHVVGTLCAWDERPQKFTEDQLNMLRVLADHAIGIFQMGDALERARHATEQLARQSRNAREIVETSFDPYYSCDREGRITFWNTAAENTFGWSRAEVVGSVAVDRLVPGRNRPTVEDELSELEQGTVIHRCGPLLCKDGTEKIVELQMWASRHESGRHVFARDVTAAQTVDHARRAAEELLGAAFRHASDGIVVIAVTGEDNGRIVRANPAAGTLTGRGSVGPVGPVGPTGLIGLTIEDVLAGPARPPGSVREGEEGPRPDHPDDVADRRALLEDLDLLVAEPAGTFPGDTIEHLARMPVGPGHLYIQLVVTLTRDEEGTPEHALVQMRDVTAAQAHEQWLKRQTRTDPLTGLANRLALRERLNSEIARLRDQEAGLGVLMVDLDNFHVVNDELGFTGGDDLIARTATVLAAAVPQQAFTARLGGDQFVVLTRAVAAEAVHDLAERVAQALGTVGTGFTPAPTTPVTVSVGVTFTRNPASDPEELLKDADTARYQDKRRRRSGSPAGDPVDPVSPAALHAVPSPRGSESRPVPAPTPAPRHTPVRPGDTAHPARSRKN
nr:diguanylate cyclase [Kineosporia mesophila]